MKYFVGGSVVGAVLGVGAFYGVGAAVSAAIIALVALCVVYLLNKASENNDVYLGGIPTEGERKEAEKKFLIGSVIVALLIALIVFI